PGRIAQGRGSMLELLASKGARAVLRGGGAGDSTSLPDRRPKCTSSTYASGHSGPGRAPPPCWPASDPVIEAEIIRFLFVHKLHHCHDTRSARPAEVDPGLRGALPVGGGERAEVDRDRAVPADL